MDGLTVKTVILLSVFPLFLCSNYGQTASINTKTVKEWASKLGGNLMTMATYVSRKEAIQEGYKTAVIREVKGESLLQDIAWTIQNMTESKISAVRRIMDTAENTAQAHQDDIVTEHTYYNAKNLSQVGEEVPEGWLEVLLTRNKHFYDYEVNTSFSAVHVPTNVFDKAPELLKAVKWSETLDSIFISNYQMDPSLSWQYFGSSLGFMRQYPAIQWKPRPTDVDVDLYDCRTRSWYIEAATSPKDVIILVDNSGSMTGMRREIARHVVNDILDTLGNNDFVNVFNFSEDITDVVPCFSDTLVQANLANIRELKKGMEDLYTDKIANFSAVLTMAFDLLQSYRLEKEGACCNQAIMLVTDGVPYNYKDIFQAYNWQELPYMPVRVFTYLIGREVPDVREVKWMACANQGYFVHLSTLAEVREKVLQYVPVMARPLVLWKNKHPTIWTPVYADVTDPKMTDWLWENKESEEQKEIFQEFRRDKFKYNSTEEQFRKYVHKRVADDVGDPQKYQLMTSVSMPVLDRRENATRIAYLLGVAGTDVPIKDIQELMLPHKLGVNGYAFLVTNNGYILIHPDLRPVFQGILKPSYNSVDLSEVELENDNDEPRSMKEGLRKLREGVINQSSGSVQFEVKYHYDRMKRAAIMNKEYHYCGIENTPFTLVISLPKEYGFYKIHGQVEIHLSRNKGTDVTKYFRDNNWKVHPDWIYCRYHYDTDHPFKSAEEEFKHFLHRSNQPKWMWLSKRTVTPPEHVGQSHTSPGKTEKLDKDSYFCDRDLFLSIIFDAQATESFSKNTSGGSSKDMEGKEFQERFGVIVSFVATHNGLTRWKDYLGVEELKGEQHFSEMNNKAIDEVWYKRAVEYHYKDPHAYVYAVPFDAGDKNDTLVTASHAIFIHGPRTTQKESPKSPAAVIGLQFQHSALHSMFKNVTYACNDCPRTCKDEELDCYILDNNGYIVVSENLKETGKFFGEVRASVMNQMIEKSMFNPIQIYDYQAVCFRAKSTGNVATLPRTPFGHLKWLVKWTLGNFLWLLVRANMHLICLSQGAYASDEDMPYSAEDEEEGSMPTDSVQTDSNKGSEKAYEKMIINRTRPQPCDMEVALYEMDPTFIREHHGSISSTKCSRSFDVQIITNSNLLLVVVDTLCVKGELNKLTVIPTEVYYNASSLACYKVKHKLNRRRPPSCIHKHPEENKIELCGGCSTLQLSFSLLLHCWLVMAMTHREQ